MVMLRSISLLIATLLLGGEAVAARVDLTFIGVDIPGRILIGSRFIIEQSDTLTVSGRRLRPGVDYTIDHKIGSIELADFAKSSEDTLRVTYRPLPGWLSEWYGRQVPDISSSRTPPIPLSAYAAPMPTSTGPTPP